MQRAVAIALAGGLLAASAGAFGLAQVLKLERSPIEAIQVDPTPNHGRGQLDRHDSALFSPRCTAPCLPAAQVRFKVHTTGPVRAEVVAPGGAVVRDLGALPHPGGKVVARWDGRDATGAVAPDGSYRLKVSLSGRTIQLLNPLALDTTVGVLGDERLAARDLARLRLPRRPRDGRRARPRAARRPAAPGLEGAPGCARCGCASARERSPSAGPRMPARAAGLRRTARTGCASSRATCPATRARSISGASSPAVSR